MISDRLRQLGNPILNILRHPHAPLSAIDDEPVLPGTASGPGTVAAPALAR